MSLSFSHLLFPLLNGSQSKMCPSAPAHSLLAIVVGFVGLCFVFRNLILFWFWVVKTGNHMHGQTNVVQLSMNSTYDNHLIYHFVAARPHSRNLSFHMIYYCIMIAVLCANLFCVCEILFNVLWKRFVILNCQKRIRFMYKERTFCTLNSWKQKTKSCQLRFIYIFLFHSSHMQIAPSNETNLLGNYLN